MNQHQPRAENEMDKRPENREMPEILVPIDNSPSSRAAADAAIQIAASHRMLIHGLYVVDAVALTDPYVDIGQEVPELAQPDSSSDPLALLEDQGNDALRWLEDRCADTGVAAVTELQAGGIIEVIEEAAGQSAILAMGRRGLHLADDPDALGHHFRTIAHHIHRPTLVGGDQSRPLRRLLLGYHGHKHAADAVDWAVRLQQWLGASVDVVVAWEDQDGASRQEQAAAIEQELAAKGLTVQQLLTREEEPAPAISSAAQETRADLIIIGGYRRHGLVEWLAGNTVEKVLRSTPLPVLIAWPANDPE
jgi:nucleotide-binding universal stress UspA family protein